jgi:hypothetical protein
LDSHFQGHVPGDNPDPDNINIRMTQGHDQCDRIVARCVGIDKEWSRHGLQP